MIVLVGPKDWMDMLEFRRTISKLLERSRVSKLPETIIKFPELLERSVVPKLPEP